MCLFFRQLVAHGILLQTAKLTFLFLNENRKNKRILKKNKTVSWEKFGDFSARNYLNIIVPIFSIPQ